MKKKCQRCKKDFVQISMKGSTRAKYCYKCRPVVRKEQQKLSTIRNEERKRQERGNIVPNDDELIFYGYKEPLSLFPGGYGYSGVLKYNKERDMVQCHICGRIFRSLGCHIFKVHNLSAHDYKIKTGLQQKTALVGEGTRKLLIEAHKDIPSFSQIGKSKKEIKKHMKHMSDLGSTKSKKQWTLERRNEEGNCPEQLIEKIKNLGEKLGRRPTAKEYQKEYGSFQSIITVWGTWDKALEMAKITTYTSEKSIRSDPQFLINCLKDFYKRYGRTPRASDMRRGLLPSHATYWNVFGTLNNARQAAGIPVILMNGRYKWEEVMLKTK